MIIDAFPFFNELDVLELRLRELYGVVDWFVAVEGDRTHAGQKKPSYLHEAITHTPDRYPTIAKMASLDLLTICQTELPDHPGLEGCWLREIAQRNAIRDCVYGQVVHDDDLILISDCDEIPRAGHVAWLAGQNMRHGQIVDFIQTLYYYNVNTISAAPWRGTRATTWATLNALGADTVRYDAGARGGFPQRAPLADAGWHLSYFGGVEAARTKIQSFLHQEFNLPEHTDLATIAARIAAGEDIYGRDGHLFLSAQNEDIPLAMRDDPARFAHFWAPGMAPMPKEGAA